MEFSLDKFYRLNRRVLIWILFVLFLWLLRDFFGLIFLTFVIAFIAQPLVRVGQDRLRLPRRLAIVLVYCFFLAVLALLFTYITPRVVREAGRLIQNLPRIEERLLTLKNELIDEYPQLRQPLMGYLESAVRETELEAGEPPEIELQNNLEMQLGALRRDLDLSSDALEDPEQRTTDTLLNAKIELYRERKEDLLIRSFLTQMIDPLKLWLPVAVQVLYKALVTMLLALLFSFLITMDITRLGQEMRSLRASRLHDFYEQTAQPLVRFGYIVGRAIQAQAMIACVNTVLTFFGLVVLGVPSLTMLSLVVFVCSFIPVLGVFISTVPIVLVALNSGGIVPALAAIILVILIHTIEAYLLNPVIYGQHFKINPVLVLIILFIGYHTVGLWGMLLGVPVAYYFIHDVFGVPVWDERRLAPLGGGPEKQSEEGIKSRPIGSFEHHEHVQADHEENEESARRV